MNCIACKETSVQIRYCCLVCIAVTILEPELNRKEPAKLETSVRQTPGSSLSENRINNGSSTPGFVSTDGTLWYYRLNTEQEKEMTAEEAKKWEQKVKKQATRANRRVEGGGVKINVTAAKAAAPSPAPPTSVSSADGPSQG